MYWSVGKRGKWTQRERAGLLVFERMFIKWTRTLAFCVKYNTLFLHLSVSPPLPPPSQCFNFAFHHCSYQLVSCAFVCKNIIWLDPLIKAWQRCVNDRTILTDVHWYRRHEANSWRADLYNSTALPASIAAFCYRASGSHYQSLSLDQVTTHCAHQPRRNHFTHDWRHWDGGWHVGDSMFWEEILVALSD